MRLLGAVLAGGRSSRFGSDKASAMVGGRPIIEIVAEAIAKQTDALVICGRSWPGIESIPDQPEPDQGPLGGLCAALLHAQANGYDAVLTAGCDVLPVPSNLAALLQSAVPGKIIEGQPLFGLWPAELAGALLDHLSAQPDRSMRGWAARIGAAAVSMPVTLHNLNTPQDLELYCTVEGSVR